MRAILVSMPFAALDRPALGVSLLKAGLQAQGVDCDVLYLNLVFAGRVGREAYERVSQSLPAAALAGEWVFTEALYGRDRVPPGYVGEVLRDAWGLDPEAIAVVLHVREHARSFIASCLKGVRWHEYDVVGFTSGGAQNLAALSLAKAVKETFPDRLIAFGGSNWEGIMGRRLLSAFPFVDFGFLGEADRSLPMLLAQLGRGGSAPLRVPLVAHRHQAAASGSGADLVQELDTLPLPEFGEYFGALREVGFADQLPVSLPVEMSRGCWWAAREPCSFCGLNGTTRLYRSKSVARTLSELRELAGRWHPDALDVIDNVASPDFMRLVLPELSRQPLSTPLFVEIRPNVGRATIRQLAKAGVSVQAGIESLSDELLGLMHKGCDVVDCLRLLKWARAYGVDVVWNLLYGVPGETRTAYEEMAGLLEGLRFLQAPTECGPVALQRFSPYHDRPRRFGLRPPRPLAVYRYLYPFSDAVLRDIAFYFEMDPPPGAAVEHKALRAAARAWRRREGRAGELRRVGNGGHPAILDTRRVRRGRLHELDEVDAELLDGCDDVCSRKDLLELGDRRGRGAAEIETRLTRLARAGLLVRSKDRYLSLALPAAEPQAARWPRPSE